jgi:hypothetical protein
MTVGHCWRCGAYGTLKDYCGQWLCEHCLRHHFKRHHTTAGSGSASTAFGTISSAITFRLRHGGAEISFGSGGLALQLAHASGTCKPGAVSLGLVEVIPLACVSGLGLELVQVGSGGSGA